MENDKASNKHEIGVYQYLLEYANRSNQFGIFINRVEPKYDFLKAVSISSMVQGVSFINDSLQYEEVQMGSSYINIVQELQSGEIALTLTENQDAEVFKFLTLKEDGSSIIPKDGTFLLPYEYYFQISIVHHFNRVDNLLLNVLSGGDLSPLKVLASGFYKLDGNLEYSYEAGEDKIQAIQAKFKPMMGWEN